MLTDLSQVCALCSHLISEWAGRSAVCTARVTLLGVRYNLQQLFEKSTTVVAKLGVLHRCHVVVLLVVSNKMVDGAMSSQLGPGARRQGYKKGSAVSPVSCVPTAPLGATHWV